MDNSLLVRIWLGRASFLMCGLGILIFELVPLRFTPSAFSHPDLVFGLAFAILLRRPEFVPVWLLTLVLLLADFLLLRPVGLWTAIVILAAEFARSQEYRFRELSFPFEWAFFGAVLFLALILNRSVLALMLIPQAGFSAMMLHFLSSFLIYPLLVLFSSFILRIRKFTPHEALQYGRKL